MPSRRALLVAAAILALVPSFSRSRLQSRAYRLRLDGYTGPPPAGQREVADLTLRVGAAVQRFQVTTATVLRGDALGSELLERVRPYKPSFVLRGPESVLATIAQAKPGTRLSIIGEWVHGSRDLNVASIDPAPAEKR